MYPFHALTVHVPIGLLLGNAVLTALYLYRGDASFEGAAYHCLWLGWIGALIAVAFGIFDAARQVYGSAALPADALGWINAHGLVSLAILVIYWQAWQIRRRRPNILAEQSGRRGYLARIGLGVLLIGIDGWLGGHLVYALRLGIIR